MNNPKDINRVPVASAIAKIVIADDGNYYPESAALKEINHYNENVHLGEAVKNCFRKRVAIQAGGCVGLWANKLAVHFGHVLTFEPDPTLYECLCRNKRSNVASYHVALGVNPGEYVKMSTRGMMTARVEKDGDGYPVARTIRIDDLIYPDGVDLIQLDIEGYEFHALLGGINTIQKNRPVIQIEMRNLGEGYGVCDRTIYEFLSALGYVKVKDLPRSDKLFVHESQL